MNNAEGDSAIQKDAQDGTASITGPLTEDEAVQALMERSKKAAEKPADAEQKDTAEEPDESKEKDADGEADDDNDSDDQDEKPAQKRKASDEDEVEIKVGDEVKTVSVAALKRLFGQEASLTKKSMDLAARRDEAEAAFNIANGVYLKQLEAAKAQVDRFSKLDFEQLAQNLPKDQFAKLRAERDAATNHFKFLAEDAKGFAEDVARQRSAMQLQAARETLKILQDDIPGWNSEVYSDVRSFAIEGGIEAEDFDQLTSAPAIKMLHRAMSDSRELKALKAKTERLKAKLAQAPKNAVSSGAERDGGDTPRDKSAMQRLTQSGSTEDAAEVFLARARARRAEAAA